MADYEPLELSRLCNVGIEVLPPAAKPLIGEQMLHGLPFLIGSPTENDNSCFVGLGPGLHEGPLRVPVGRTAQSVLVAHTQLDSDLIDGGGPLGDGGLAGV
jgi:hypothetical protein